MRDAVIFLGGVIAGVAIGGLVQYVVSRRVELVLRMTLDRLDEELEHQRARADKLLDRLVALRREGYVGTAPGRVIPAADPEGEALRRGEAVARRRLKDDEFVRAAVAKIKRDNPSVSDNAAAREAEKLLEAARMEQPPA